MIEAISEDNIYCKGIILENNFPIELLDEIYSYYLYLESNKKTYLIFILMKIISGLH